MKKYPFSPLLGANLCLSDKKRVNSFERAIKETVREGDVVLDVGTGTGILLLQVVKHGAKKVYAVEVDKYLSDRVREIARRNRAGSEIEVINRDILDIDSIGERIDVVLMEMLTTGLIEEAQIPAYNHLVENGIITPSTRIIPASYETYAVPLEYDFREYGFDMPRAKHTTAGDLVRKLSDKKQVSSIDFDGERKKPHVRKSIEYLIRHDGNFNAIGLTSVGSLSSGVSLGESTWINNSVVIPIDRSLDVRRGDKFRLDIGYVMGNGFAEFYAEVTPNKSQN